MKRPVVIGLLVVALLFVLAGIGSVVFFAVRGADFAVFNVPLVSATAEESKTLKVDGKEPVILSVDDDAGDVSIVGADVEVVEVNIFKTGYGSNDARAEEALKGIKYELKQNGNKITFVYKLDGRQTREVNTVDLIVTVPTKTVVDIENGFGTVDVSDVIGSVDISSNFGDVTAQNIEGALTLDNSSGEITISNVDAGSQNVQITADFGKITLEKVNGKDINIDSNSGTVMLKDVKAEADLSIKSDFGDSKFENGSAATLTVETNSGKVELIKLKVGKLVKVENEFGDIELSQVSATTYDLQTNSGTITVDGAKGGLKAYTDFGNIGITNAQSVTLDLNTNSGNVEFSGSLGKGPHTVISEFGNIVLALPADSKLNVSLKTDFGNIKSDLPVTVTLNENSSSDGEEIVGAINGGGEELSAETNSGNININAVK